MLLTVAVLDLVYQDQVTQLASVSAPAAPAEANLLLFRVYEGCHLLSVMGDFSHRLQQPSQEAVKKVGV